MKFFCYNTGICVSSSSCRSGTIQVYVYHHHHVWWWWYTYSCILPDLHDDDDTHIPVLYQIYMMMMVHIYLYCTRSTWWWWYTYTCIVPDLHDDDDTHIPVLYQIYMMIMVHIYLYCTRSSSSSCRSGTIQVYVYHHHHVDLVQCRYMCIIIIM
jgi:hypothetical protein